MTIFTFGQKQSNSKINETLSKKDEIVHFALIGLNDYNKQLVREDFRGKVILMPEKWPKDLGEKHPFNFFEIGRIVKSLGYINSIVNKYVDYIVGGGIRIVSENKRAEEIINQWIRDNSFETLLRAWVREALIKGNGCMELAIDTATNSIQAKLLDASTIYIVRNDKGSILGYKQYIGMNLQTALESGNITKEEVIEFGINEIAHLPINKHSDEIYGTGLVFPALQAITDWVNADKDMHMLLKRKANSPIVAKIGSIEANIYPRQEDVDAMKAKLENLKNNQEFAHGPEVEMKTLDFGKIGEKFDFIMTYDRDEIHSIFQVPAVLMGLGNIPEGLAQVQMEAFMMNVKAMQDEIEKVIEEKIFKIILQLNGLDNHVELEWGQPNQREIREKIEMFRSLLGVGGKPGEGGSNVSPLFRKKVEQEIGKTLGWSEEELLELEEQKEAEMKEPQPIIPGQNNPKKEIGKLEILGEYLQLNNLNNINVKNNFKKYNFENINEFDFKTDMPLTEWLQFNYIKYLQHINQAIDNDEFINLKADTQNERLAGYLTEGQVNRLKGIFKDSFERGENLNQISERLIKEGKIKDLLKLDDNGNLILNEENDPEIRLEKETRTNIIARTETTRLAGEGQQLYFKDLKVERYRWVSTLGTRTCPICEDLNGQIFNVGEGPLPGEPHIMCRCTTLPVRE